MDNYKVLIGIEMHCEISKTNTKVFSRAENSYKDLPNSNIRPVDLGFPGTLPVVNKEAVKKALMASIILGCKQPDYIYFERKNYYYPDLPKGFQITQETKPAPIGIYGELEYDFNEEKKKVRINNIHLEEDSASLDHYSKCSTINYNRAGVPLLELVTEPDFRSPEEVGAFLETMRLIYQYADISEADSKKGQVRCDVNVSIMDSSLDDKDPSNWGTKVEIKNVNSFSGVKDAINYEIKRQIELKNNGTYDDMEQQTRRWDETSGTTIYMRGKVDAIDYKYFVEPNIPKFKLSNEWIEKIKKEIPVLASERKNKYLNEYMLSNKDANTIIKDKSISDYYEELVKLGGNPQEMSNWLVGFIMGFLNKEDKMIGEIYLTPKMLVDLISSLNSGKVNIKQVKEVLTKALEENKDPNKLIVELGLSQITDSDEIRKIINEVLDENTNLIEDYKNGKRVFDYLVGMTMKKSKGRVNPKMTNLLLKEELDKR